MPQRWTSRQTWALPWQDIRSEAKKAAGLHGRLFARALYLEDADGNKAALCYVNLMSASRYVLERAACFTAPACGISVERLLLAGTHTHTAPGHFYGNPLFDTFAQSQSGFDQAWADWVAEQIAATIIQAAEVAVPAQLVVASEELWGITQNRSYGAFVHNFDTPATWNQVGYPGQSAPALPRLRRRAVDPRVTVLVAVTRDGTCLGAFASFACHATCMGNDAALYTPDWPGYAVRQAGRLLADEQPVIAVALSAAGDVNGLQQRDKGDPAEPIPEALQQQGAGLAQYVGDQVGNTIAAVVQGAREHAVDFTLETRYAEPSVGD